jgi:hypothetical protein
MYMVVFGINIDAEEVRCHRQTSDSGGVSYVEIKKEIVMLYAQFENLAGSLW